MSRRWLRLFACVCLAAFLVANSYAGAAIVRWLAPARCACQAAGQKTCCHCERCATKAQDATPTTTPNTTDQVPPCGPSCPKGPSCPVPGGCACCNIAKVPSLPPVIFAPSPASFVGEATRDVGPLYVSPFSGHLCRPPKA